MGMADWIIIGILVIVIGAAILYIRKAKKSGAKCIGCPDGGSCAAKNCGGTECSCGCHTDTDTEEK